MNSGVITINCAFSSSWDSNSTVVKERDSAGVSEVCSRPVGMEDDQNLKETELRLGLPGDDDARESNSAAKMAASGAKRGFSEAMASRKPGNGGFSGGKWVFPVLTQVGSAAGSIMAAPEAEAPKANQHGKFLQQGLTSPKQQGPAAAASSSWQPGGLDHSLPAPSYLSPRSNLNGKCVVNEAGPKDSGHPKMVQERPRLPSELQHGSGQSQIPPAADPAMAPASKAQVVGWPPIRSFRKNTLAANPKPLEENEGKPGSNALYVKVSMDGAPYLRKVDLKMYSRYQELSSALEKMFSCFTIGQCGSHGIPGRDGLSESNLMDLLHGSEYVLTYEDKDGDWMLVGDVPWQMFVDSCKKLRITKASEAIGLAPRAMEKCKNRS